MQIYKCLLVDDEKLAQELLESYLDKIPYLEHIGSCSTALQGMQALLNKEVDILFLDIQMPDLTGIELLQSLKKQPATILTTAYEEYALKGYELEVVDYLLKPIEFDRFFQSVNKAVARLSPTINTTIATPMPTITPTNTPDYFFIKSDTKIVRIAFDDVLYVEALQKYIRIYTKDKRVISLFSLSKIEELLPSDRFVRIHRSFVVHIDKIDSIEGNMVKIGEATLPISRGQRDDFMLLIKQKGLFL